MKELYFESLSSLNDSNYLINEYWEVLNKNYSKKNRHYHNWQHIQHMILLWENYKIELESPIEVLLAIFYHDAIYKVTRKDNEAKSAKLAENHLKNVLNIDLNKIKNLILATQFHISKTNDEKWLVDFDLNVLGKNWEELGRILAIYSKNKKRIQHLS